MSHHPEAVTVSDRNLSREKHKMSALLAVVTKKIWCQVLSHLRLLKYKVSYLERNHITRKIRTQCGLQWRKRVVYSLTGGLLKIRKEARLFHKTNDKKY